MITKTLEAIRSASGTNAKIAILAEASSVPNMAEIFAMAYDPFRNTFVKKLPAYEPSGTLSVDDESGFSVLRGLFGRLSSREVTGNAALAEIAATLSRFDSVSADACEKTLLKDLRVGMGTTLINKAFGREVIRKYRTQLSFEYEPGKDYGTPLWLASPKYDGIRAAIHADGSVLSREGKAFVGFEKLASGVAGLLSALGLEKLDGEFHFEDPRQERDSDGMPVGIDKFHAVQSAVLGTKESDSAKKDSMFFHAFAVVGAGDRVLGKDEFLNSLAKFSNVPKVKVVPQTEIPDGPGLVGELSAKFFSEGFEGVMLRAAHATYDFRRSNALLKCKPFYENDFRIVEILPGKDGKRLSETMGMVVVEGEWKGFKVRTEVGSGWSDAIRGEIWNDKESYLGKLIEVQFQGLEATDAAKASGTYALRFPSFLKLKLDREG